MIKAIGSFTQVEFISKYDNEKDKTIFLLGSISTKQMGIIQDMLSRWRVNGGKMEEIIVQTAQRNYELVKCGLKGWKNFKDNDKDVIFSEKNSEKIPIEVISEIADKLLELNTLSFVELKN